MDKEQLNNRQSIIENYDSLIKSIPKNVNQVSLFDEEPQLIAIPASNTYTSIELLERERSVLGLVASLDYIEQSNLITDLIGVKRLSDTDLSLAKVSAIAVCLGIEVGEGRRGPVYYGIFGDSYRVIKVSMNIVNQNLLIIGNLYLIKYLQFNTDKEYASYRLIKLFKSTRLTNYKLFKRSILEITNNGPHDDESLANDFLEYIKSIESDIGGTKVLFLGNNDERIETKIFIDNDIYKILTNYYNLNIKINKQYGRN